MTTPRDAIGLSERLRDRAAGTGYGGGDPLCAEAATQLDALHKERQALRAILSNCATAIGNGAAISPECSLEFMANLPDEIAAHTDKLRRFLKCSRDESAEALNRTAALQERVKDYEVAYDGLMKAKETFRAEAHRNAARATRAEQERASEWNLRREAEGRCDAALAAAGTLRAERDEAYERLKPFANGSIDVSGTAVIVGYPDAEHALKAARNCVRQLKIASGPDKEKK